MIKNVMMSQENNVHKVDLSKIEGDGSFPCPTCGTLISPEDESEKVYNILETKVDKDELVALVISCKTCGTVITLTGFQITDE
ncbi:MAG: hypothetical protein NWF04_10495 [Candidatus Bathyarchaeota archaeon]|nr:hypothetical protein [Candidatus Bathyarchaeota archaeon]